MSGFVVYWGDVKLVPEQDAALRIVAQRPRPFASFPNRDAQLVQGWLVPVSVSQEAAVKPARLLRRVACDLLEPPVDVDNRVVGPVRVGNDDAVGGGRDGPVLQTQLILHPLTAGDVPGVDYYSLHARVIEHIGADGFEVVPGAVLSPGA